MKDNYGISSVNKVRQLRNKARYDKATVHAILDAGLVAHVAFAQEEAPVVVPIHRSLAKPRARQVVSSYGRPSSPHRKPARAPSWRNWSVSWSASWSGSLKRRMSR